MAVHDSLERMIRRLGARVALDDGDREALRALPFAYKTLDASSYMVREGEPPEHCYLLLAGFAFRHKVTGDGGRQILSVQMPGEFLNLQNSLLEVADHNVQALTRVEVASIPFQALRALVRQSPKVGMAMWIDTLIDAAICREWIVNVGRRDSTSRIAHLLCEFALRLRAAGLGRDNGYELPMTQEQIADAVGLTPVHVNRVLKDLGRRALIERNRRAVTIVDWDRLRQVGDFSSRYLHMDRGGPMRREAAQDAAAA